MIKEKIAVIEIDNGTPVDISKLSKHDWRQVDKYAKVIMADKMADNEKVAFVAGFLVYVATKQAMNEPFGEQH